VTAPEKVLMPRYRCVHCRKSWANRATALEHTTRCWYDPANRGCKTCMHFSRGFSGEETCLANRNLPVIERHSGPATTLAVHCSSHRVDEHHVNPDVLDTLHAAEATT
jgi:hypothetical protein